MPTFDPNSSHELTQPIRVLLADDHQVVLAGYEKWLRDDPRFDMVGKARTVEEAVELCRRLQPDVAVTDLRYLYRDRADICHLMKAVAPNTRVVMYSAFSSAEQVSAAFNAGADGYFDKHAQGAFLPDVVTALMRGEASKLILNSLLPSGVFLWHSAPSCNLPILRGPPFTP